MKLPTIRLVKKYNVLIILIALIGGVSGIALTVLSHAATPTTNLEVENGTLQCGSKITDSSASGSAAVRFNACAPPATGTFVLRQTKPTANNVGAGIIRPLPTQVATSDDGVWSNGVLTIYKDLKDRVVPGHVKIGKSGLTVENNIIKGDPNYKDAKHYLVDTGGGFTGTVLRYNDIGSSYSTPNANGVGPRNVTAEYNDISHVTDAFSPSPSGTEWNVNMTIRGNYVHNLLFFGNDPSHDPTPTVTAGGITITGPWAGKPWNHADVLQVEPDETTGIAVYGNNFVADWANDNTSTLPLPNAIKELSCFMLNGGRNLVIEDNWLDGGEYCVNNADSNVTGTFKRNKFGRGMAHRGTADSGYYALMIASPGLQTYDGTSDQNVWEDTGNPVLRRPN